MTIRKSAKRNESSRRDNDNDIIHRSYMFLCVNLCYPQQHYISRLHTNHFLNYGVVANNNNNDDDDDYKKKV